MATDEIRVVIVDDHDVVRAGLAAIIDAEAGLLVAGEAGDGDQVAALVQQSAADVVLMDVSMPQVDGLAGLRSVLAECPGTAVIMLTTFNVEESIEQALRAGASGYLLKTAPAAQLISAIRAVHRGERVFSADVQERLIASFLGSARTAEPPDALGSLTDRETEVFAELARGKSNAEIAETLYLSEATVKTYVTRILAKLGLRDRVQAVIFAVRHGLSTEPD